MDLDRHPLTYLRRQRGWSLADLARKLRAQARAAGLRSGIDRNRVWRWEQGIAVPNDDSQRLLADLLNVPASAVEQSKWPGRLPAFEHPAPFSPAGSRVALREVQVTRMERRSFLIFSSGALVQAAADWARLEPRHLDQALAGQPVDTELVEWLEQRAAELRRLPPGPQVNSLVDAHLHTVIDLLDGGRYPEATGRRLHAVTADLSHCAAWIRFDADRHAAAQRHWQASVHAAHQAGNRDLAAVALADLAYQATWLGHPEEATAILGHARSRTSTPAVRSLIHIRTARARAVLQDGPGVETALGTAENELERIRPDTTPPVVSWIGPADLNADAGRCRLDLGQPHRAETAIGAGLEDLDPRRTRTQALFLAYRAESAARRRDAATAAQDARAALDMALESQAQRCIQLVTGLINQLSNRPEQPLEELREYAHDRLKTTRLV
ncbi:helix-turn-helix transcriptional regulator [Actinocorallia libanotica]|uniref:HTH cro/C1-type domain-containing protein n=1 Tax=Actinocorallia libanotica TaxID=46162 RepID=A0ABN1RZ41_9ACTN